MQEQIDEFREREETTKVMYEKILSALDGLDANVRISSFFLRSTQSYAVDNERLQELLVQICKTHQSSPKGSTVDANASFARRAKSDQVQADCQKQKIEELEAALRQGNETTQRLKIQLGQKEKENAQLILEVTSLQSQLEKTNVEQSTSLQTVKQEFQSQLQRQEQALKAKALSIEQELSKNVEMQRQTLEAKIKQLESQVDEL